MRNYIYSVLVLFFVGFSAFSQTSNWLVEENDFQYTMSIVAFVNIDGVELSSSSDMVATFVGGECRGVTKLIYVQSEERYYAYLTVFSNINDEDIDFKVFDAGNNKVIEIEKTLKFQINEHYGNLLQAYSISNSTLSKEVEILNLEFEGDIIDDIVYDGSQIILFKDEGKSVTNLNAVFSLSAGAELFVNGERVYSGNNSIDFTKDNEFQIRSQDQTVLKSWTVSVSNTINNITFYKKDAVCYANGVIKLLASVDGLKSTLIKNGDIYATKLVQNGAVVFNDLEVGTYTVKLGGDVKEITINLKE